MQIVKQFTNREGQLIFSESGVTIKRRKWWLRLITSLAPRYWNPSKVPMEEFLGLPEQVSFLYGDIKEVHYKSVSFAKYYTDGFMQFFLSDIKRLQVEKQNHDMVGRTPPEYSLLFRFYSNADNSEIEEMIELLKSKKVPIVRD